MFFLTRIRVFVNRFMRTKSQGSCYIFVNINYTIAIKIFEDHIEFKIQQIKKESKKSVFKEKVENSDLYKYALNKIMTTHEQCMKNDFVAPLKVSSLVDISIKDHPLKFNCAPNYQKNVSDKHIGI